MSSLFNFKQFAVDQSGCTMRINTDGVLLGALAAQTDPIHILDIGTGTGVIGLMLAQRYPSALVDAVEIDSGASQCAELNFKASPFASRLSVYHSDIMNYESEHFYDLIVSNPPYHINSLQNPDERKKLARHTDQDFLTELVNKASSMLAPGGSFWLVLPLPLVSEVRMYAQKVGLSLFEEITITDRPGKQAVRQIIGFSNRDSQLIQKELYIRNDAGEYSEEYRKLLADFFTIF